jgi:uncharacterized protein YmfQ (DUF2313 family)
MSDFPEDRHRQLNEWMTRTGKSGRAFYRRLQEVGYDITTPASCRHTEVSNCQTVTTTAADEQSDDSLTV